MFFLMNLNDSPTRFFPLKNVQVGEKGNELSIEYLQKGNKLTKTFKHINQFNFSGQ